jgi:high mobility group protein B1
MLNAIINSLKICEIGSYTKKLIQFVGCIVATMKTAKGKDKVKTTKEALKPVDDRKVGKRKAPAEKPTKRETRKEKKAKKDPNKPKRAPSAFFVFLEDFRVTFKKENPNVKAVSAVGKAGGQKWKSMSQAEKAPYEEKAAKRKAEYEKQMDAYNKNLEEGSDESEKSRSEINDEDEASGEEELLEKEAAGDDEEEEEEEDDDDDDDEEED